MFNICWCLLCNTKRNAEGKKYVFLNLALVESIRAAPMIVKCKMRNKIDCTCTHNSMNKKIELNILRKIIILIDAKFLNLLYKKIC